MLAQLADLPSDPETWAFEVKWDGIRAVAFVDAGSLRIETRNQNDVTAQYPDLAAALPKSIAQHDAVIDVSGPLPFGPVSVLVRAGMLVK